MRDITVRDITDALDPLLKELERHEQEPQLIDFIKDRKRLITVRSMRPEIYVLVRNLEEEAARTFAEKRIFPLLAAANIKADGGVYDDINDKLRYTINSRQD